MKTSNREILIYYNPQSGSDRKTIAQVRSLVPYASIHSFENALSSETGKQPLVRFLHLHASELLSKVFSPGPVSGTAAKLREEDWLDMLRCNPGILEAPLAIRGDKSVVCVSATDVYQLLAGEKATIF